MVKKVKEERNKYTYKGKKKEKVICHITVKKVKEERSKYTYKGDILCLK